MLPDDLTVWGHRTPVSSPSRYHRFLRRWIITVRAGALLAIAVSVVVIWRLMSSLPWQLDGLLAICAALAWAYRFERQAP